MASVTLTARTFNLDRHENAPEMLASRSAGPHMKASIVFISLPGAMIDFYGPAPDGWCGPDVAAP